MARKTRIDMAGRRFGRLVGVAYDHTGRGGRAQWLFACDCGGEVVADGGNVRAGTTTSCGCFHREVSAERLTVHGHRAAGRHGPSYRAWQQIKTWCGNPRSPRFPEHGGRGVAVAPAWADDYPTFLADMGERPAGTVLARRDPAGDFAPGNCRWVAAAARRSPGGGANRQIPTTPPSVLVMTMVAERGRLVPA